LILNDRQGGALDASEVESLRQQAMALHELAKQKR
jgi:hypothetical protein